MALPLRADNSVVYRTPNLNGFTFVGLYSLQRDMATLPGGNSANSPVTGLGLSYDQGPVFAMISYDRVTRPVPGKPAQTALQIAGTYDFNVVKLHLMAGRERGEFLFSTAVEAAPVASANFADIGLTIPVGSGRFMLGLQSRNASQSGGYGRRIESIGYTYDLSKLTSLNMAFSNSTANKSLENNANFNFMQVGFGISHYL
jgi:predicted porin